MEQQAASGRPQCGGVDRNSRRTPPQGHASSSPVRGGGNANHVRGEESPCVRRTVVGIVLSKNEIGGLNTVGKQAVGIVVGDKIAFRLGFLESVRAGNIIFNEPFESASYPPATLPSDDELHAAGELSDRAGFTQARRAWAKYGGRPKSAFQHPTWNPHSINQQGSEEVQVIPNDPASTKQIRQTTMYRNVIDVSPSDGRGLRYSGEGQKLLGFLEP